MSDETMFVRCPAHLTYVAVLRHAIAALCGSDTPEPDVYQVQLAVSELATNIVTHAYGDTERGTIEFAATRGGDRVTIDVYDTGQPFTSPDPAATLSDALVATLPDPDALLEGGYGLFIIGQTMDVMTHTREADARNHWHLEKRFGAIAA